MSWNTNPKTRDLKRKLRKKEEALQTHIDLLDEYRKEIRDLQIENERLKNEVD